MQSLGSLRLLASRGGAIVTVTITRRPGPHGDGVSLKSLLRWLGDGRETVVLLSLHSSCCGSEEEASGWRGAEQEAILGRGNGRGHISRPTGIPSTGLEQLS